MPRHFVDLLKVARNALGAGLLALASLPVHATLITFGEFPYTPNQYGEWGSDPIGDDYAALGVHIDGGYRFGAAPGAPAEGMLGGDSPSITFTGTLPTFVSLNLSSAYPPYAAEVSAWTPHGFIGRITTGGWDGPSPDSEWTPYIPNTYASFHSSDGISRLLFSQFWGMRTTVRIDNLYFGAVPSVPEPGSFALLAVGLGVVGVARRRMHGRHRHVMAAA